MKRLVLAFCLGAFVAPLAHLTTRLLLGHTALHPDH